MALLPHAIDEIIDLFAQALPILPEEKRREHLQTIAGLIYQYGNVDGRLQLLAKLAEELKEKQKDKK